MKVEVRETSFRNRWASSWTPLQAVDVEFLTEMAEFVLVAFREAKEDAMLGWLAFMLLEAGPPF